MRAAEIATPMLILSALASVGDRIEGLECGSDDYLVKPFSFAELLARVNALLRRGEAGVDPEEHRLCVGDLEIDPLSRSVRRAGKKLDLKPREYLLLEYFARNEGRVVTRTMLLEQVWDYHFDPGTNVIDVHVSRLRRKLEEGFERPLLHTVRGAGYMLAAERLSFIRADHASDRVARRPARAYPHPAVIGFIYWQTYEEAVSTVHRQVAEQGRYSPTSISPAAGRRWTMPSTTRSTLPIRNFGRRRSMRNGRGSSAISRRSPPVILAAGRLSEPADQVAWAPTPAKRRWLCSATFDRPMAPQRPDCRRRARDSADARTLVADRADRLVLLGLLCGLILAHYVGRRISDIAEVANRISGAI